VPVLSTSPVELGVGMAVPVTPLVASGDGDALGALSGVTRSAGLERPSIAAAATPETQTSAKARAEAVAGGGRCAAWPGAAHRRGRA
jgi:hypothetical protein